MVGFSTVWCTAFSNLAWLTFSWLKHNSLLQLLFQLLTFKCCCGIIIFQQLRTASFYVSYKQLYSCYWSDILLRTTPINWPSPREWHNFLNYIYNACDKNTYTYTKPHGKGQSLLWHDANKSLYSGKARIQSFIGFLYKIVIGLR